MDSKRESISYMPSGASSIDVEALKALLYEATLKLQGIQHVEIVRATNGVPAPTEGHRAHEEHGVAIDHKIPQANAPQAQPELWWSRTRHFLREPLSEFMGTFILILFGDGVVAQNVTSKGTAATVEGVHWAWG